jgi:hypothetical protein
MFKSTIGATLGSLQFFFLLGAGLLYACGIHVPWVWILTPLWMLFSVALVFWVIVGVIWKAVT